MTLNARPPQTVKAWSKSIPEASDRRQSELLTGAVGMLLAVKAAVEVAQLLASRTLPQWFWVSCSFSIGFAIVAQLLRAATTPAAAMGGLVCLHILLRQKLGVPCQHTAMPSLLALFLLTYGATKFGRARKEALGTAEERRGRRAAQVLANLGVAGLLAAGGTVGSFASTAMLAACIAALAEATADTVSSEAGQALADLRWGRTLLITTGKSVPPGTDGGVSVAGTAFGALAAAIVILASPFAHDLSLALCVFAAAVGGLFFDSVLGATVERRGWLGNDLVNFISTVFAATIAFAAVAFL